MADIDLNGDKDNQWAPIGTSYSKPFNGIFDGADHIISGLYINLSYGGYQGLFGCVGNDGIVKNLGVDGSISIAGSASSLRIGGVVGRNYGGTVKNCYNKSSIVGTGDAEYVGGVVGDNSGTVENCYNSGSVEGKYGGGVVGHNIGGTVKNCHNTGNVGAEGNYYVGGVVGLNGTAIALEGGYVGKGTVENCYNTGSVVGDYNVGGVVGCNNNSATVVESCYNIGNITGTSIIGGVVGYNLSGTVKNCYNTSICIVSSNRVGGVVGYNDDSVENCYYLGGVANGGINGSDVAGQAESKTEEEFASGEVRDLLQGTQDPQVWYQTIGADAYPRLAFEMSKKDDITFDGNAYFVSIDGTITITATIPDAYGLGNDDIIWSSSNEMAAEIISVSTAIDEDVIRSVVTVVGNLTGVSTITVTVSDGREAQCDVTCCDDHGNCGDNLRWSYNNGTLTISGTGRMDDYEFNVNGIETPWREYNDEIKSIIIKDGVESIGHHAFFSCKKKLSSITFPSSICKIGNAVFNDNVKSIYFKGDAPEIDSGAFTGGRSGSGIVACYPVNNTTWTEDVRVDYNAGQGRVIWQQEIPNRGKLKFSDIWYFQNYSDTDIKLKHYLDLYGLGVGASLAALKQEDGGGGHCYGMVSSTTCSYNGNPDIATYEKQAKTLWDVELSHFNSDLLLDARDIIGYSQIHQYSPSVAFERFSNINNLGLV
ncbi:leucine-rich repeat domain-containing protein [Butyricicoccus sp. 1XD8-22]|nr:leucine-rich repeat domain-containing protein [Butyricicoccus sp. 1XD8-22]